MSSPEDFRALAAKPIAERSLRKKSQRELLLEVAKASRHEDDAAKEHEMPYWKKD